MTQPIDVIVEALCHLVCSDREERENLDKALWRHHRLTANHFDGFECLVSGDDDDDFVLMGSNASDLPVWPIDVCTGHPSPSDGDDAWPAGTWQFVRTRTLDPKAWRGKLRLYAPKMIEKAILTSRPDGQYTSVVTPYAIMGKTAVRASGWLTGLRMDTPGATYIVPGEAYDPVPSKEDREDDERMTISLCAAAGLSLRRYYLWSVLLGEGQGPRARFVTDPIGVREVFRLRDIPPGRKRRAALLHWVRAHWRQSRRIPEADRLWINAHLRGAWSYKWNGLLCQIEPSIEDMSILTGAVA